MNSQHPSIGIIGVGMVGAALKKYFEEMQGRVRDADLFLYDTDPRKNFGDDINHADIIFIAVPTPRRSDGSAGLDAVISALEQIRAGKRVVLKSTVPPGTTQMLQKRFQDLQILFNPEFLTEAHAWENMIHPDRQLVGWTSESRGSAPMVLKLLPTAAVMSPSANLDMTATEAEIVKYAANYFLTRKVTFANAMYDLARHHDADYESIRRGIGADPRIGASHLDVHHGGYRGYGGYCFVKDTDGLIAHCRTEGLEELARFFENDRLYNERLLDAQALTSEDVSVHDHEWIRNAKKKII